MPTLSSHAVWLVSYRKESDLQGYGYEVDKVGQESTTMYGTTSYRFFIYLTINLFWGGIYLAFQCKIRFFMVTIAESYETSSYFSLTMY